MMIGNVLVDFPRSADIADFLRKRLELTADVDYRRNLMNVDLL